jgi:soluble lytic murein transglycosylase
MAPQAVTRLGRRLLIVIASCTLVAPIAAQTDTATLESQRAAFEQAYAAANQGGDSWRSLATGLRDYPLYPYLQAASLEHDIQQTDRPTVEAYLKQNPDLIPADDLRRNFLTELARRQDWTDFQAMYQPGLGDALTCDALQAKLAGNVALDFDKDLAGLWSEASLPSACDPVLQAAHDQGLLTPARLWARIDLAADAGKGNTISTLAPWLPDGDAHEAQRLALALNDSASTVRAAGTWPDTPRSRQAATLALVRLARRQSDTADEAWQSLQGHFQFAPTQRNSILNALAVFHATDYDAHALQRLIDLPASAQTDTSREWRVRVALAEQNWSAVLAAIDAMPASQRQDDEWQYFRARALSQLGRSDEAQRAYNSVAMQSSYFGYLAADHQNTSYSICSVQPAASQQGEQDVLAIPGIRRAFELFAVDMLNPARREWNRALANADAQTIRQAVVIADQRGWYDRAVFAFNNGQGLHYYTLRFPLGRQYNLVQWADQAGIDPYWAYGILRVESAWMFDAHSGADARGLMQLVPGSAAEVARRNGLPWSGGNSLFDPSVNIQLGTRYLAQMADRFNGSLWLASAAYNAGAARANQWLDQRSELPPDVFVATIPFKETREYVARVMYYSVIYDWRLNGNVAPISTRMAPLSQVYSRPTGDAPRKTITCATPPEPASTTTIPAPPSAARLSPAPSRSSAPATEPAH